MNRSPLVESTKNNINTTTSKSMDSSSSTGAAGTSSGYHGGGQNNGRDANAPNDPSMTGGGGGGRGGRGSNRSSMRNTRGYGKGGGGGGGASTSQQQQVPAEQGGGGGYHGGDAGFGDSGPSQRTGGGGSGGMKGQQQQQHQGMMGPGGGGMLGTGSYHGVRGGGGGSRGGAGMMGGGGYGMRGNPMSQTDYTLSPGGISHPMLSGNYMGDMSISPNHLAHRMSLGYSGSPSLSGGAGLGDSNLVTRAALGVGGGSGQPMTAEEQAAAEREEELLLSLLIARRQRGRSHDGSMRNQQSLADELARLKASRGAGSGGLGSGGGLGELGASSQGSSMRMNRGITGGSTGMPGLPPLYGDNSSLDYAGGGGYPGMGDFYPSMSRGGSGMMGGGGHHRLMSDPLGSSQQGMPHGYSQQQLTPAGYGMSGSGMSGHHMGGSGGMPTHSGSGNPQYNRHKQLQMMQQDSERIMRTPARLLMDARSAQQSQQQAFHADGIIDEFSDRGMKRGLDGQYGIPGPFDPAGSMNYQQSMEMQGGMYNQMPPKQKTKRTHKKKPVDMPRRPLSAYNLFFSEERERILAEIEGKDPSSIVKEEDKEKGEGDGGDDDHSNKEDSTKDKEGDDDDGSKPKALLRPLIPAEKKRRPHRKTHGKISFQQLARMVGERWKGLPSAQRKYYQDLAQEDMKRQKVAMEEYYAKQNSSRSKKGEDDEGGEEVEPHPDDDGQVEGDVDPNEEHGEEEISEPAPKKGRKSNKVLERVKPTVDVQV